jgi:hypothetical protein
MSKKQVEINTAVHTMVSFIKETVTNNLAQGSSSGIFQIEESELRKIAALVSDSIDQGFLRSHSELEAVTKNI